MLSGKAVISSYRRSKTSAPIKNLVSTADDDGVNCNETSSGQLVVSCKLAAATGSVLEQRHVDSTLQAWQESLDDVKINRRKNICQAVIDTKTGTICLEATSSSTVANTFVGGYTGADGQQFLYPEEMQFLAECAMLRVTCDSSPSTPLSIQQSFRFIASLDHRSLTRFLVYSRLVRDAYSVVRHLGPLDLSPYEIRLNLHSHSKRFRRPNDREAADKVTATRETNPSVTHIEQIPAEVVEFSVADCSHNKPRGLKHPESKLLQINEASGVLESRSVDNTMEQDCHEFASRALGDTDNSGKSTKSNNNPTSAKRLKGGNRVVWHGLRNEDDIRVDQDVAIVSDDWPTVPATGVPVILPQSCFDDISFPDEFAAHSVSELQPESSANVSDFGLIIPDPSLLPAGIAITPEAISRIASRRFRRRHPPSDSLAPSRQFHRPRHWSFTHPQLPPDLKATLETWAEYKAARDNLLQQSNMHHPLFCNDPSEISPLTRWKGPVPPKLRNLQLVREHRPPDSSETKPSKLNASYDVYSTKLKGRGGIPNWRIVLTETEDVPYYDDVLKLKAGLNDGVPLLFSIAGPHHDVSFFNLEPVSIGNCSE